MRPSASLDPLASKSTLKGTVPSVGVAVKDAAGDRLAGAGVGVSLPPPPPPQAVRVNTQVTVHTVFGNAWRIIFAHFCPSRPGPPIFAQIGCRLCAPGSTMALPGRSTLRKGWGVAKRLGPETTQASERGLCVTVGLIRPAAGSVRVKKACQQWAPLKQLLFWGKDT